MFRIKLGVGSYTPSKEALRRVGWPFWTYSLPKILKNSDSDSAKELVLIWVHWTYASALMYPRCLGLSLFFSTNWGYQSKTRFRRRSRGNRKKTERQKRQRQKGRKDRTDRRDRKDRRAERYGRTLVDRLYIRLSISKVVFVGHRLDAFCRVQCQVRGQAGRTVLMYAAECGLDDVAWLVPKDPCIFSYLHLTSSQTKLLWFTF